MAEIIKKEIMKKIIIRYLPVAMTLANLACGCVGVVSAFKYPDTPSYYFIGIGFIFDLLDGLSARVLKVESALRLQLDSLADVVTFGVLPSVILYKMLASSTNNACLPFIAFFIALFSAYRLARFNTLKSAEEWFVGLPTPVSALFICGLPLFIGSIGDFLHQSLVLLCIVVIFSWLLVSQIKFFSNKWKNAAWKHNKHKYVFLLLCLVIMALPQSKNISWGIALYVLSGLIPQKFWEQN